MRHALSITTIGLVALGIVHTAAAKQQLVTMEQAQVRLEYNAVDDDAEAVIVLDAGVGFTRLAVFGPNGRLMHEITAHNRGIGLTKLPMETPEPSLDVVKAAYPAGVYRFEGRTVDGSVLTGKAVLAYDLLPVAVITAPASGATGVPLSDLTVTWNPVPGAAGYFIELEDDAIPAAIKADLPSSASSFKFSGAWLKGNTEHILSLGAIGANGNIVYSEVRFRTRM